VIGYTSSPLAANLNSSPTMLGDPQNIIDDEAIPGTEYAKSTKIKRT
jgi:Na+/H+ antiporter NhaD/arsenite permease-like protein